MSPYRQLVWFTCLMVGAFPAAAAQLDVPEGAQICIIGGGVADAMQHTGWLEVMLQSRFPDHQLVIRNLAYEGDEIDPAKRLRSAEFGSLDQWLAGTAPIPNPGAIGDKNAVRENRFELTNTRADIIWRSSGQTKPTPGQRASRPSRGRPPSLSSTRSPRNITALRHPNS